LLPLEDGGLLRLLVKEQAHGQDVGHRQPEVQVSEVPEADIVISMAIQKFGGKMPSLKVCT
jgi:hypothetical protein